ERGLVGRIAVERERRAQHVASKGLRRLGEIHRLARERLTHDRPIHALHGVPGRDGGERGAVRGGGRNGPADEIGGGERPRGVVNHDDVALPVGGATRGGDGVPAARAATHQTDVREVRRRRVEQLLRQRDDHLVHVGVRHERADAPLEDRLTADGDELLRPGRAEARSPAAGRDDGCHVHGTHGSRWTAFSVQTADNRQKANSDYILPNWRASTSALTMSCTRSANALASCAVGRASAGGWMASWTTSVTSPGSVCSRFFGITWRVPMMASGTTGRPASIASRKLPPLKRATCPSGLRDPSA